MMAWSWMTYKYRFLITHGELKRQIVSLLIKMKLCFAVHEKSKVFLGVPGLDDLLVEPMLQKRHGTKMVKVWGKSRQLCSQTMKSKETLGQLASMLKHYCGSQYSAGFGDDVFYTQRKKDQCGLSGTDCT
jgi:hypothetical protein